jgi:hypothetical protein
MAAKFTTREIIKAPLVSDVGRPEIDFQWVV